MDIVLFSGMTALCVVVAAMSSLIGAELRDRRRMPYRRAYGQPHARPRRPAAHVFGRQGAPASARARPGYSSSGARSANPWAPFAVQSTTSLDDIKRQYRSLARRHHPDRGGDPRMMAHINNLYAELVRRRS